jgi:hypothetical protein
MKEALQEIPSKKIGGVPENALLKAASLSDRNVEVTWLRNSAGKALLTRKFAELGSPERPTGEVL